MTTVAMDREFNRVTKLWRDTDDTRRYKAVHKRKHGRPRNHKTALRVRKIKETK